MLIHGDGNSNIRSGSCFDLGDWIADTNSNLVLMNPPYNASKSQVPKTFASTWGKSSTDPTKGLYFVKFVADKVKQGRLLVLLPMQCAIKTDGLIGDIKQSMLEEHTLDAVFSFPIDMFYPGASAVACCMAFDLGKPHPKIMKHSSDITERTVLKNGRALVELMLKISGLRPKRSGMKPIVAD